MMTDVWIVASKKNGRFQINYSMKPEKMQNKEYEQVPAPLMREAGTCSGQGPSDNRL
jgi:hypothetical protein